MPAENINNLPQQSTIPQNLPSASPQPQLKPNPLSKINPSAKKILPVLGAVLIIILISLIAITQFFKKPVKPESYSECRLASGSTIDPNNPGRCITQSGEEFINPSIQPLPSAASPTVAIPLDWKDYSDSSFNFSLKYPSSWKDPVITVKSKLTRIQFNSTMIIEDGVYTSSGTDLNFNQFVEKSRPPARTVIDYSLAGIQGKRFLYEQGDSLAETLIAVPRSNENEILTISYKAYPYDTEAQKVLYQILASFKFKQKDVAITTVPENQNSDGSCKISGCNAEICQDNDTEDMMSICIYKAEYACYKNAKCEKQSNGKCGWTETEDLKKCISDAGDTPTNNIPQ